MSSLIRPFHNKTIRKVISMQGAGAVPIPGGVLEKSECGSQYHSLVHCGHRLDSISKVFSKHNLFSDKCSVIASQHVHQGHNDLRA